MAELLEVIIPAGVGLITGAVGSLVAPWANWKIEETKQRHQTRRELIEKLRKYLEEPDWSSRFEDSSEFSRLKLFLGEKEIIEFASGAIKVKKEGLSQVVELDIGFDENKQKRKILEKLGVLEKRWRLL
jgi:hypothetical protein